jgi:hypothetical protein
MSLSMEVASKLGGLAAIVAGGFMILMAFGFATLGEGDRDAPTPAPLVARLLNTTNSARSSSVASCSASPASGWRSARPSRSPDLIGLTSAPDRITPRPGGLGGRPLCLSNVIGRGSSPPRSADRTCVSAAGRPRSTPGRRPLGPGQPPGRADRCGDRGGRGVSIPCLSPRASSGPANARGWITGHLDHLRGQALRRPLYLRSGMSSPIARAPATRTCRRSEAGRQDL